MSIASFRRSGRVGLGDDIINIMIQKINSLPEITPAQPVKKRTKRTSNLMFQSRLDIVERAYVELGIPVETISHRYGLSINMLKIYQTKYKWIRKRRAYLDKLVFSDEMDEHAQHVKYRQALASEMWERMSYKVERYMDQLEPTLEDDKGELRENPEFIGKATKAMKVAKDARLMERLEYGQSLNNSATMITDRQSSAIKGLTVIAPDSVFKESKQLDNGKDVIDGTISEAPRIPVGDIPE